ncbi:MAG: aspartate aminotransferase family protein [Deltaproteobacteria bacterium]|nr:aspartate aminotransferase family protein [Deltaproteobacteria bacterium]
MNDLKETKTSNLSPLLEVYAQYPFELERGEGIYVYDTNGKRYLDFYGGHAVSLLGHSPRQVLDAIKTAGEKLMFYSNLARIPIREKAAAMLLDFADARRHQVFFCNSGGEANENALKVAIKNTGRSKIASFVGSFHGRTLLAIAATDKPAWHDYLRERIGEVVRLKPNNADDLKTIDDKTAAVILEPIQSIGGVTEFDRDFLKALRERCDQVGAYLIFDEVQTGMGRTGIPFVSRFSGVSPDMTTLAKGLAAGFPIGALIMAEHVSGKLKVGDLGATFGGGPMAMAAMMATIESIKEQDLVQNARKIGDYVREVFAIKEVAEVRGRGCLLGLKLHREAKPVQQDLFKQGIIVGLCSDPQIVHLLPPLTTEKEHVDALKAALLKVL